MPIGPPSYLPEPKSAWTGSDAPIARTIAPEFEATGSLSTRWFQGLFFGKMRQCGAPARGWPDPLLTRTAEVPRAAVAARSATSLGLTLDSSARLPMCMEMRRTALLASLLLLVLPAGARADAL